MIIPKEFPYPDDLGRQAEKKVFEAFNKIPDQSGFDIFYNKIIYNDSNPGYPEDGEADFVVFHEELGFIVVEVKGGIISYDGENDQWFSETVRSKKINKIKNPFQQAVVNKYAILNKFKELWPKGVAPRIDAKRMVIFPDVQHPDSFLGIGIPEQFLICGDQIDKIEGYISKIFLINERGPKITEKPGSVGRKIFQNMFSKSFELKPSMKLKISEGKKYIEGFDNRQKEILNVLKNSKRIAFQGGAGTGKSFLCAHKAIELNNEGKKVALICGVNKPFSVQTKYQLKEYKNIHVSNFHGFCKMYCDDAKLLNQNKLEIFKFYEDNLLNAIENSQIKFDCIVIDEAQDLNDKQIGEIMFSLKDPDQDSMFLFYDNNQRLYGKEFLLKGFDFFSAPLELNYRNSIDIFEIQNNFYTGNLKSEGPPGESVQFLEAENETAKLRKILKLINQYKAEGINFRDIGIISGNKYGKSSSLAKELIKNNIKLCSSEEVSQSNDEIMFDSIIRFKGLEKDIIILTDIEEAFDKDELMYIALSRARLILDIVANSKAIDFLKNF